MQVAGVTEEIRHVGIAVLDARREVEPSGVGDAGVADLLREPADGLGVWLGREGERGGESDGRE